MFLFCAKRDLITKLSSFAPKIFYKKSKIETSEAKQTQLPFFLVCLMYKVIGDEKADDDVVMKTQG